jgi:DNA-binding response OmpR family regulator
MRGAKRRALAWEAAFPAVEETACASDSCCVLVVDEEPEVSEMLAEILSLDGHQIETAPSGNVAMRILAERSVEVILSDHAHARCRRTGLPYLEKPLSPDEVRRVVRQVLAGAGTGSE